METLNINQLLLEVNARTKKENPNFYRAFQPKEAKILVDYYRSRLLLPEVSTKEEVGFINSSGTMVARGYTRVVIGHYGAYVEFSSF